MMSNNTINYTIFETNNSADNSFKSIFGKILSYFSLVILLVGICFNTFTFIIIYKNLRKITSMIYISYISVNYTLSLFTWNLDQFLLPTFGFRIEFLNIINCKIFMFIQLFSLQSSGFLLTMLTIDRYFTIISTPGSFISRLPFRTPKSAHLWSVVLIGLVFILNCHILILNGTYVENKSNSNSTSIQLICNTYSNGFELFPLWENVHLILYSLIPFIIMMAFNILLIIKIKSSFKDKNSSSNSKKDNIKRNVISILFITFVFLIMTTPVSVAYGFFSDKVPLIVLNILDELSFLNNSTLFFSCFFTNLKFRKVVFDLFKTSDSKYQKSTTITKT